LGSETLQFVGNMNACVVAFASMFVAACTANDDRPFALVGGTYNGSVTNDGSTCADIVLDKTKVNNAVVFGILQMGPNVTIQVDRLAIPSLEAIFGTNLFSGTVTDNHIDATITGTVQITSGSCVYTFNGALSGNLGGNILTGDIVYTPKTNGHADCISMRVTTCIAQQTFGVTRTP
jgi:hypothetical protein